MWVGGYTYKSLCQPVEARIADLDTSKKADSHTGELLFVRLRGPQRIAVKSTPGSFLDVQAQTEKQTEGSGLPGPSQLRQDENEKVRTAFLSQILFYF